MSVGTRFHAEQSIDVGGTHNTLLYATHDVAQTTTTRHETSSFAGVGMVDDRSNDSNAQSTAVGTQLISTERVQIGVGNKAFLGGTQVQAPDIAFVKIHPGDKIEGSGSGKGDLVLAGSMDTTQSSHTESSETAGVWQEAKGHGSTDQHFNHTLLDGQVHFDDALTITAQIPKDSQKNTSASALAAEVHGLAYLKPLLERPGVQWEQVKVAHDQWQYDQQGLTPAGAALLSIAVAVATTGAGTSMLGTTAVAQGALQERQAQRALPSTRALVRWQRKRLWRW